MRYTQDIILDDPVVRAAAAVFEAQLPSTPVDEQLLTVNACNERDDDESLAKLLLLVLAGDSAAAHEVRRIFAWTHRAKKAQFCIAQLTSDNDQIIAAGAKLAGVLREPSSVPYLGFALDLKRPAVCPSIIEALETIRDPRGVRIISRALSSSDHALAMKATQSLSRMGALVPWKTFIPLLKHPQGAIRLEASFAIAMRRNPKAARALLAASRHERDRSTRIGIIRYLGMIPAPGLLSHLISLSIRDSDQKVRLAASRSADRLQSHLPPKVLFRLRMHSDPHFRAEVLYRLGKFGSEEKRHKQYLRTTAATTHDPLILQACLEALGCIAEHADTDLFVSHLSGDPMTSYSAAFSLTRVSRPGDANRILQILVDDHSPTHRQIFLKYLIRRRGLAAPPEAILRAAKPLLEEDANINVRYLAFALLQFAPLPETIEYLLTAQASIDDANERDAIAASLRAIVEHAPHTISIALERCDPKHCGDLLDSLPDNLPPMFARDVARTLVARTDASDLDSGAQERQRAALGALLRITHAAREVAQEMLTSAWRHAFLQTLAEQGELRLIAACRDELIAMLADADASVSALAMMHLISLRDVSILPAIISRASAGSDARLMEISQHISRSFVQQGVL